MTVGIDMEETKRFELTRTDTFVQKNFTHSEQEYCFSKTLPHIHLAGFFCAKEAYRKATQDMCDFLELSVVHLKSGKPVLHKRGAAIYGAISISHTQKHAIAMCIETP
ncbi:MAG: phosphopantetheine--protein transferase-like protein [Candidatus Woesearchaeota archaeon]|jgi:phosphopantetheine--protein transferase-like protein